MAHLTRGLARQRRHEHAVIVDELDRQGVGRAAGHEQDVAMLQVGVGDAGGPQSLSHASPDLQQAVQHRRLVEILADELVEGEALDPLHFEDRIPLPADADPFLLIGELDGEGQLGVLQGAADFLIAFAQAGDLAGEAFDGPARAVGAAEFVDVGEVAGARQRDAESVADDLALLQFRIG